MRANDSPETPLLGADELSRLQQLLLQHRDRRRRAASAAHAGPHRTALRGHGMELHDMRPYQPGDDIRHMDWRATARSGRPITKVFIEERARSLFLIVDRRPSMMFGTRRELKAATAARVTALLAFAALAERESVSGVVLEDDLRHYPPARELEGVLPLLHAAAAPPYRGAAHRPDGGSAAPATVIARHAPRGASLCMVGDLDDIAAGDRSLGDYLPRAGAGYDLSAVRVVDPAERRLEDTGLMRLVSPETGEPVEIDTGNGELRERYQAHMAERDVQVRELCRRQGVALTVITNDGDTLDQLEGML